MNDAGQILSEYNYTLTDSINDAMSNAMNDAMNDAGQILNEYNYAHTDSME